MYLKFNYKSPRSGEIRPGTTPIDMINEFVIDEDDPTIIHMFGKGGGHYLLKFGEKLIDKEKAADAASFAHKIVTYCMETVKAYENHKDSEDIMWSSVNLKIPVVELENNEKPPVYKYAEVGKAALEDGEKNE